MSLYALQKALRDVNRRPDVRAHFFSDAQSVAAQYDLTDSERAALAARDYHALYAMGVHGLLLRPFSILHKVPEAEYLNAIRGAD